MFEPNKIYFVNEEPTGSKLNNYSFPVIFRIFNPVDNTSTDVSYNTEGVRKVNTIPVLDLRDVTGDTSFNRTLVFNSETGEQGYVASTAGIIVEKASASGDVLNGFEKLLNVPVQYNIIANKSFENYGLSKVNLNNVKEIGDSAFAGNMISEINLMNVTSIGISAFNGNKITSLDLKNVTSIGEECFLGNQITSLDLKTVTNISRSAFSGNMLTSLDLKMVTSIGDSAFAGNKITSLDLKNVTSIGDGCFSGNPIKTIDLKGLTNIPRDAFTGNKLETLDLKNVINIGDQAFFGHILTDLFVPDTVKSIGFNAFNSYDFKLKTVSVPAGLDYSQAGFGRATVTVRTA